MIRKWLATRLRYLADRIDRHGAPKGIGWYFTYEKSRGLVFNDEGRGPRLWYYGDDEYEKAYLDSTNTMNLHWFDISMDTSMRDIGWVYVFLGIALIYVVVTYICLYKEGFRFRIGPNRCKHINTRCLHGDEIVAHMKVYGFRFWKHEIVYRQICLYCNEALDRPAICTAIRKDLHVWSGDWTYIDRDEGLNYETGVHDH